MSGPISEPRPRLAPAPEPQPPGDPTPAMLCWGEEAGERGHQGAGARSPDSRSLSWSSEDAGSSRWGTVSCPSCSKVGFPATEGST